MIHATAWTHSSRCASGACVQVRAVATGIQVRDSKQPDGPVLTFTDAEWLAFIDGVVLGEFDPERLAAAEVTIRRFVVVTAAEVTQ